MKNKSLLRDLYLKKRELLSKEYVEKKSKEIKEILVNTQEYKHCQNIFVFLPIKNEINTKYIVQDCFEKDKNVFVPVLTNNAKKMSFSKLKDFSNLEKNKFQILEPIQKEIFKSDEKTLILTPGLVFSKDKYRIGYGGGYYDKFLAENIYFKSIGLCFEDFLIKSFKADKFDMKVDLILTENYIF